VRGAGGGGDGVRHMTTSGRGRNEYGSAARGGPGDTSPHRPNPRRRIRGGSTHGNNLTYPLPRRRSSRRRWQPRGGEPAGGEAPSPSLGHVTCWHHNPIETPRPGPATRHQAPVLRTAGAKDASPAPYPSPMLAGGRLRSSPGRPSLPKSCHGARCSYLTVGIHSETKQANRAHGPGGGSRWSCL
jgi:hypothetical protein